MPKEGFRSITVADKTYDDFYDMYMANKEALKLQGVDSFSGFVVKSLNTMMEGDRIFSKFMPKIEKISVDKERVILRDNIKNRIAEITFKEKKPYCNLCNKSTCQHIGFCYSLTEFYNTFGVK